MTQLALKPRLSHTQIPAHDIDKQVERSSRLFRSETTKEAHLNEPGFAFVMTREFVQRVIDSNHDGGLFHTSVASLIDGQFFLPAAAFLRVFRPGVIDENLTHHSRGYA